MYYIYILYNIAQYVLLNHYIIVRNVSLGATCIIIKCIFQHFERIARNLFPLKDGLFKKSNLKSILLKYIPI